jgi:hypothetical protein
MAGASSLTDHGPQGSFAAADTGRGNRNRAMIRIGAIISARYNEGTATC